VLRNKPSVTPGVVQGQYMADGMCVHDPIDPILNKGVQRGI
jgi:hypothetical protein